MWGTVTADCAVLGRAKGSVRTLNVVPLSDSSMSFLGVRHDATVRRNEQTAVSSRDLFRPVSV